MFSPNALENCDLARNGLKPHGRGRAGKEEKKKNYQKHGKEMKQSLRNTVEALCVSRGKLVPGAQPISLFDSPF